MRGRATARRLGGVGRWTLVAALAAAFAFPLYWLVTMAFKSPAEWNPPGRVVWFPENPTLDNFRLLLGLTNEATFVRATFPSGVEPIIASVVTSVGGTALALAIGILSAYGIARFRAGGRPLPFAVLLIRVFPPILLVIPLFFMWVQLGLWDTYQGLILIYGAVTFPLVVWLVRSFLLDVPREIAEAAIVDGCTHWGAFFKAVLPQVKGGIAVAALFVFIVNWSDLMIAEVLTLERAETATVYLAGLRADEATLFGPQAALGLILMIPPLALGLAIRRYLVRGITLGALRP